MAQDQIPHEIRRVLDAHIRSVGHLEIFLFLYENRDREFDVERLSRELRTNPAMVIAQLLDLGESIIKESSRESSCIRFNAEDGDWVGIGEQISNLYRMKRHTLIAAIYERPIETIRSFADAFKIKKD